jgi:hypothetical protein
MTSLTASGDFAQTNTCGSGLAAGSTCTISVTFTPSVFGSRNGSVTLTDNTGSGTQTVSLIGTGLGPSVRLSQPNLAFGNQNVGSTSAPQTVTLSNTGNATLTITSLTVSGDFAQTNTCGSSLAAGSSCTISVTFTPSVFGSRNGLGTLTDNVGSGTQTVSLSGTGLAAVATLSPSSLSFGNQNVGSTSAPQTVTLSNTGNAALAITRLSASGDFTQTNACGSSLAAGGSCTISVTFTPSASGTRSGTLTLTDNAGGGTQTVTLTGIGMVSTATFSREVSALVSSISAAPLLFET